MTSPLDIFSKPYNLKPGRKRKRPVCFSRPWVSLLLLSAAILPVPAATVNGKVILTNSKSSAVMRHKDFSDVVVWLQPLTREVSAVTRKHAQIIQKNKKFTPHILAITTGSIVDFPNLDPIFHNAFSNFDGQIFDVALYPPGTSRSVRFSRPGIVRVFCNIHPSMSAIIVVLSSPYFTETNEDGAFTIQDVPEGRYELHFFHERATPETLQKLTKTVSISQDVTELPSVTVSETGYLPLTHKNKYGREYPPTDDEHSYSIPNQ